MISLNHLFEIINLPFTYESNVAKTMWRDKIQQAKKDFKIFFDLENNDLCRKNSQKDIIIPQKQWEHTKCRFRCQMWQAGGDWEIPLYYFKCQLLKGYAFDINEYDDPFFIFIPGKTDGNYHLIKNSKDDGWKVPNNHDYKDGIDPEPSKNDCWKSLEKYLTNLVNMEIEKSQRESVERSNEDASEQKENTPESV
jgi:hypothetical protein